MGWSSGTEIADVFKDIILMLPKGKQYEASVLALNTLEDAGWDNIDEVDIFHYVWLIKELAVVDLHQIYNDEDIGDMEKCVSRYKKQFGW